LAYLAPFSRQTKIAVENSQFFPPVYLMPLLKGFSLEFGIGTGSEKTRMMGLPDGRKSFKIGLAVLIIYRRVTDTHPASHVAIASTALTTSRG